MSRESMVIMLGLLVIFVPVFGIPNAWKQPALITIGLLLMVVGYTLRRSMYLRTIDRGNGERGTDSFVEAVGETNTTADVNETT